MSISGSSSKSLAEFLHVDPSRISQLKTGRRGRPRSPEVLSSIASYFSRHCTSNSQRMELSEVIGNITFSNQMTTEELTDILFHWLEDTPIQARYTDMEELRESIPNLNARIHEDLNGTQSIFYGNEGKRNAVRLMYQTALQLDEPQTIYMCTEENPTWYYEDPAFLEEQEAQRLHLVQKGFHIIHILDLNTALTVTFENVIRWIPAYMTGNVEPYYYPRIRDGVFNHTIMIIPGKLSLYSASIANNPSSRMTIVTSNSYFLEEISAFMLDYFKICIPAMNIYGTVEEGSKCIEDLSKFAANRIQKRLTLPPNALPQHILKEYGTNTHDSSRVKFARFYMDNDEKIRRDLEIFENIEICPLASAAQVRSGCVRIEFPSNIKDAKEFYTPEEYSEHLENVIHLLETYDKFHFIPIPYNENDYTTILIKQSKKAVLMNTQDGLVTLDTEQSDMVKIFHEYLLRYIDYTDFRSPRGRQQIIGHLKSLIVELKKGDI